MLVMQEYSGPCNIPFCASVIDGIFMKLRSLWSGEILILAIRSTWQLLYLHV